MPVHLDSSSDTPSDGSVHFATLAIPRKTCIRSSLRAVLAFASALAFALSLVSCSIFEQIAPDLSGSGASSTQVLPQVDPISDPRHVAVVFDTSGSMVYEDARWAYAEYALETLVAMKGAEDTVSVVTMHVNDRYEFQDVSDLDQMLLESPWRYNSGTDPTAISTATDALSAYPGNRYLVILTDGQFTEDYGGNGYAAQLIKNAQDSGVEVVFIAVGTEAGQAAQELSYLFDSDHLLVADTPEMLTGQMVSAANLVFQRDALTVNLGPSGEASITSDIPMQNLVVFAQGNVTGLTLTSDNVSSSAEDGSGQDASTPEGDAGSDADGGGTQAQGASEVQGSPESTANSIAVDSNSIRSITQSDSVALRRPGNYDGPMRTEELSGVVSTFTVPGSALRAGSYTLQVQGECTDLQVYYVPYVAVNALLTNTETGTVTEMVPYTDAASEDKPKNFVTPGTYEVDYRLVDPFTNADVSSSTLLSNSTFSLYNKDQLITDGILELDPGSADLWVEANLGDAATTSQHYYISLCENNMVVDASAITSVDLGDLGEGCSVGEVLIRHADGSPVTDQEWANYSDSSLSVVDPTGLIWTVAKGDPGVYLVYPNYVDGDRGPGHWKTTTQALGFLGFPSRDVPLSFNLQVVDPAAGDALFSGAGSQVVQYHRTLLDLIAHWLIPLIILLLLLAFIIMEIRKPRLPKIMPYLELDSGEQLKLSYNKSNLKHRIWPPWAPETTSFTVRVSGDSTDQHNLKKRFALGLQTVGLEAEKKVNGKKRFKVDEATIGRMKSHTGSKNYPDPEYSVLKKNSLGQGSSIKMVGNLFKKRTGEWKPSTDYKIVFKKPKGRRR